ncbi:transposase [Edwardsiella ictaluri]|uniref:Transposase, IS3/IS911 family protein n=2 Tax=Edwardsiella ictaluri TaxID=67780 RepID=C5B8K6_EDWI9|nr:hypothetical protein [Edwardsiella ictaluri]ACR69867.1 transposase, IS3/IS911 family protein [Edwardsiella ictaluri 93-146]KMQ77669.1 transposase [Edwardsiella ictaluri]KOO54398.1 transposase [Edwardsiella ictaluri]STP81575.1 Transposase [Edwardsiella ictaluri]
MGTPRFTPEFKEEAVRQITERGYSVTEVSERLGVSAHSLYKWLRAIKPDNSEQYARDLLEAKTEILKLRAQLKHTEGERDILKQAETGTRVEEVCRKMGISEATFYIYGLPPFCKY